MDEQRFDRLTRALGGATTRRAGITGALAGAIGAALWRVGASGLTQTEPEGPCGDGSKADNICSADRDCCTRHCDTITRRCRCLQRGERCKANQSCCGSHSCINNVCTSNKPPAPPTRTPVPTATPTGTLTPSPTPTNTPVPEPCTVCASGCQFTSVNDAIKAAAAGSTITVAPGTWITYADVSRNLTIRGCTAQGGSTSNVILQERNPNAGVVVGSVKGATVTLANLTIAGNGTNSSSQALAGYGGHYILDGVKIVNFGLQAVQLSGGSLTATSTIFSGNRRGIRMLNATFTGTRTDFYGDGKTSLNAIQVLSMPADERTSITINQGIVTGFVGSAFLLSDSDGPINLTLDSVVVRNNTGGNGGAGAAINAGDQANILLKGTTAFRSNRATASKGATDGGAIRLKIKSSANARRASLKIVGNDVEFRNNQAVPTGSATCSTCAGAIEVECNSKTQVEFSRVRSATYTSNSPINCALLERASGGGQKEVPNCNFG